MATQSIKVQTVVGEFELKYPAEVIDYIQSRKEQREFYKPKKPGDAPEANIPEHFAARAKTSVDELVPLLEKHGFTPINHYMDIGCGFGATTALMARALNVKQVILIEGRGTPLNITGFNQKADAWNDVMIAKKMVAANLTRGKQVVPCYFDALPEIDGPKLDLITSFRSWGHHYPVSTYLEHTKKWLKPGGALCLDVRLSGVNPAEGIDLLKPNGFQQLAWVSEKSASAKSKRLLFRYEP